jgi:predicted DNA-binding protein YlxM (UPF0122 family)
MPYHKNTRIKPEHREKIYFDLKNKRRSVSELADEYRVSRPTIYKIIKRGKHKDFSIHKSTNKRYQKIKKR